jgi:hypothetical protein
VIVAYEPAHALILAGKLQDGQFDAEVDEAVAQLFGRGVCAWTCLNGAGEPVAAAGIMSIWHNRALAWALIGRDAGPHMREVTLATLEALDACPRTRVEMYVRPGFHEAFRWAKVLGFEFEAILEGADPLGGDMAIFKRIKGKSNGLRAYRNGRIPGSRSRSWRIVGPARVPRA